MRVFLPALLGLASCTLATDASDRHVDPSLARDLDYSFLQMDAHQGVALDVVLASAPADLASLPEGSVKLRMRTHARVVLPPVKPGVPYPDEQLVLSRVMDPRGEPHLLLFYADSNDDNAIQYGVLMGVAGAEHIWREDVPSSGVGSFVHSTNFVNFEKKEYSLGTGDVVLALAAPAPDWRPAPCPNGKDHVLEVRITLAPSGEAREIGYYRNYGSNALPTKSIVLEDIADAGNEYLFEVLIDGVLARPAFTTRAPATESQDLIVAQSDWYPPAPSVSVCD